MASTLTELVTRFNRCCHVLLSAKHLEEICRVWVGDMSEEDEDALPACYSNIVEETEVIQRVIETVMDAYKQLQSQVDKSLERSTISHIADAETRGLVIELLLGFAHGHIGYKHARQLWDFASKGSGDYRFINNYDKFIRFYPTNHEVKVYHKENAFFTLIMDHLNGFCDIFGQTFTQVKASANNEMGASVNSDGVLVISSASSTSISADNERMLPPCIVDWQDDRLIKIFSKIDRYETLYLGGWFQQFANDLASKAAKESDQSFEKLLHAADSMFDRLAAIRAHKMAVVSFISFADQAGRSLSVHLTILEKMASYIVNKVKFSERPQFPWRRYVRTLYALRDTATWDERHVLRDLAKFSEGTLNLFRNMYEEAMTLQIRPPARMAIVALGSLSTRTMGPSSDVEYDVILTDVETDLRPSNIQEDAKTARKSLHSYKLVHFEWLIINFVLGFELDSLGSPSPTRVDNFSTRTRQLEEIIESQHNFDTGRNELISWLQCDLIWSNDQGEIFNRFRSWAVQFVWKNGKQLSTLFFNSLKGDIRNGLKKEETEYKLAKQTQQFIVFIVNAISFLLGLLPWNTDAAITELARRKVLTEGRDGGGRSALSTRLVRSYYLKVACRHGNKLTDEQHQQLLQLRSDVEYLFTADDVEDLIKLVNTIDKKA